MKKYQSFSSENFQFLEVKFSIYLNRRVFLMTVCENLPLNMRIIRRFRYLHMYSASFADCKGPDQTVRMHRLICAFTVRISL